MKGITLLILVMLYGFAAQNRDIALNDGVTITLPARKEKLNKEQALAHVREKFNNNKIVWRSVSGRNSDQIYRVDDILISLTPFDTTFSYKEAKVLERKKSFDVINKDDSSYTSKIEKINGKSIILMNYKALNVEYYRFSCYSKNYNRVLNGTLEFTISDFDKATVILNDLIKSIKFKD